MANESTPFHSPEEEAFTSKFTCFRFSDARPSRRVIFSRFKRLWKTTHPSEDGEALQRIGHKVASVQRRSASGSACDVQQPLNWYALYAASRHEKRVAQHLSQRQIEFYLPLYRAQRKWRDGSKVTLDLPLFPGYLFIHIRRSERGMVLGVPGALEVVGGTGGEPAALPDATIDALRLGLERREAQPHPLVTAGERVRIRSGALAGLEGIVVRSKNRFRVVLTLEHIMQSCAVEVGLEDLQPLTSWDLPSVAAFELAS